MNRTALACTALACVTIVGSALLIAGPINPPPGAVTSTLKTLFEVEPRVAVNFTNTPADPNCIFRIDKAGSYYLTDDVGGLSGKAGIEIAASDVTLDLNGFSLVGVPGSLDGIVVDVGSPSDIEIRNGSIREWGRSGIDLLSAGVINSRIDSVRSTGNAGNGISVAASTIVSNCVVGGNAAQGLFTQQSCTVTGCISRANTGLGIIVGSGSTISDCVASFNGGDGFDVGAGCTLTACAATSNTGDGFDAQGSCTLTACSASSNTENGFSVSTGSSVTACTARLNTFNGISADSSTIADCSAALNAGNGIFASSGCFVRGNTCSSNGNPGDAAGILANGTDNRVEGNVCVGADRGIDVAGAGNIIIRNTCTLNTVNWRFVAGNAYGPIIATPAGAAVNGNTAGAALGSTDPNANFSY